MQWALAAAAMFAAGGQGSTLTLDEAIAIGVRNAFSTRIAASEVEQSRQRLNEARGALGPRLSLDGTYTRFDKAQTAQIAPPPAPPVTVRPIDQKTAQLGVSMPIDIAGNIRRGIAAARLSYQAQQELLEADVNDIKNEIRNAYFRVLQAQALVQVSEEAVANAQERVKIARQQFEAGDVAQVDVLRFETQLSQAQTDLVEAQNRVRLSKNVFNNLLARPIETPFEPVDITDLPQPSLEADGYVSAALRNRPDVQALGYQREALANIRRAEERGTNPSLILSGVHQRNIDNVGGFGSADSTTTGVAALSFPLWDSGVTRARVKAARQDEEQARIRLEQLSLAVSLEVRQALSNLADARARLQTAQRSVELAQETYRLQRVRMDAGEGISIEVTEAETELTRARSRLVAARYDYLTAYAALQRAVADDRPEAPSLG